MSKNEFNTCYLCVCDQAYNNKCQLRKHISICKYAQYHDTQCVNYPMKIDSAQLSISKNEIQSVNTKQKIYKDQLSEQFKCGCEKRFQSKGGYYRHIKKCELRPEQQIVTGKTKCNEPGCLLTFKYIRDLRQHLNENHKINFDVEDKIFNRYSDFLCWKENYETETRSCFYHRKTETRSGRRIEYWYCNRSGIYQSVSQGRRRKLKSQGILKINNNCTSSLTLTINKTEGTVQAIIHHTHYGHELDLVHLRISKSDKQEIASKLLQGVKVEDILSSYKEDGLSKQIERKHLIKRRDILNISKKYNVNILLPKIQKPLKKKQNELDAKINEYLHNKDSYQNAIEIKNRHIVATQLPLSFVNQIYNDFWRISIKNNLISTYSTNTLKDVYYNVTKINVTCCSYDCKAFCNYCNICNHSYSCTCSDYSSKNIICEHIHLVVLFQVTPKIPLYEENIERPIINNQDHTAYTRNCTGSFILTQPMESGNPSKYKLKNNDDVPNKQNMNVENIRNIKIRLENLIMKTLKQVNECNNCDLLENIEKQMTNIIFDLDTDLLRK